MRSLLIKDDDIVIKNGNLQLIDGDLETCQCVQRAITTRLEEFFLNIGHGMDYEEFESKAPNIDRLKLAITEAAMQEERLKSIDNIDIQINRVNRTSIIIFTGTLENDEEIQGSVVI